MPAKYASLWVFILIALAAESFGALFLPDQWYAAIRKPTFAPPIWAFLVAWNLVYLLNALAGWRLWQFGKPGDARTGALALWAIQLIFNAIWAWLFYGLHRPAWAFFDLVILFVLIGLSMVAFARVDRWALWLFVPYACWILFAASLNYAVWQLNPHLSP